MEEPSHFLVLPGGILPGAVLGWKLHVKVEWKDVITTCKRGFEDICDYLKFVPLLPLHGTSLTRFDLIAFDRINELSHKFLLKSLECSETLPNDHQPHIYKSTCRPKLVSVSKSNLPPQNTQRLMGNQLMCLILHTTTVANRIPNSGLVFLIVQSLQEIVSLEPILTPDNTYYSSLYATWLSL